jgi:hypothetical protein
MFSRNTVDNLTAETSANKPQKEGGCQPLSDLLFLAEDVYALGLPAGPQQLHRRPRKPELRDFLRIVPDHGWGHADDGADLSSVQPTSSSMHTAFFRNPWKVQRLSNMMASGFLPSTCFSISRPQAVLKPS